MTAGTGARATPGAVGRPLTRIDGNAKVTGAARFPSDQGVENPAFAYLVTSTIARGRIVGFRFGDARAVPGVLDILSHENVGGQAKTPPAVGVRGGSTTTMEDERIWHFGQIIALVVAETFEAAREAAHRVEVDYEAQAPSATFGSPGATEQSVTDATANDVRRQVDAKVGDAPSAFASAPVKVDATYSTPVQHHNPMELLNTTCEWQGGKLTIHESSQFVHGLRAEVADQLGMDPEDVRVLSRFVGGAFGGAGVTTGRTAWVAVAARRLKRPVKLEATRKQGFTIATYRAETRHRVRLAASRDGRLQAVLHEGWEATSRPSTYSVSGTDTVARLYASPNVWTKVNIVHLDRNTPGYMRAPPETPYLFALESAMDELAHALDTDPVDLRRINDTQRDPVRGLPYTSRHLNECFAQGAQAFGWQRRARRPASMRDGEWLVGYGCAATTLHASIEASSVRMTLTPQGRVKVETAAHDFGNGTYTVIAQVASDRLGVPVESIEVLIGDSDLPASGQASGSKHCSTVCNVVAKGCEQIRSRMAKAAVAAADSVFAGRNPATLSLRDGALQGLDGKTEPLEKAVGRTGGRLEVYAENVPPGSSPGSLAGLWRGRSASVGGTRIPHEVRASFGAQFVEVRVHERTREIHVPRALGAYAAGTIINPVTARSQLVGGMIWGVSAALHEETEIDVIRASYTNDDLGEYLVPVNADIGSVEVITVPERDAAINELGIKGVGELGVIGMNAAVANAVFHATGVRVRELPIRIEKLL